MILDFVNSINDYLTKNNLFKHIKCAVDIKSNKLGILKFRNYFLTRLFFHTLSEKNKKIYIENFLLRINIFNFWGNLPDHSSYESINNIFLNSGCFNFAEEDRLQERVELFAKLNNVAFEYYNQDENLITAWQKNPGLWVANFVDLNFQSEDNYYHWVVARLIYDLGFKVAHSQISYYNYLFFINETSDYTELNYHKWLRICSTLNCDELNFMELANELVIANDVARDDFLAFNFSEAKLINSWPLVTNYLLAGDENLISDDKLIDFIYNPRLSRSPINKNEFYKIDNEKSVGYSDWHAFWVAFKLIQQRQRNHALKNGGIKINNSSDVFEWFGAEIGSQEQENVWCIALNSIFEIISFKQISKGIVNETYAHPREIFNFAIKNMAVSIIIVHNHPSGDIKPSANDLKLVRILDQAAEIIDIEILDYIIITENNYFSVK